jgi:GGDEF domain-containing protein
MNTLSPFLNGLRKGSSGDRKAAVLGRVVSILLQGIALHSYDADSAIASEFQTAIRKVRNDFEHTDDEDTALILAGSAIRLMDDHNSRSYLLERSRQTELEEAVALVSHALLDVTHAGAETTARFEEMQRELASAHDMDTLLGAKDRLSALVESIRDELANPGKICSAKIPEGKADPVTGLPDYGFAVTAIAEIWADREDYYAALFAAERLEAINTRFGFQAGDGVLQVLSDHTARNLSPGDRLFRWRGPCLMALIKRQGSEGMVATEMARLTLAKIEHTIAMKGRDVLLPVSTSWNLLSLSAASGLDELLARMNAFAASRIPQRRPSAMAASAT